MWKKEDVDTLISLYNSDLSLDKISVILNKTELSVYKKLKRLDVFSGQKKFWSEYEILELKKLINDGLTIKNISLLLNRSYSSIRKKINRLDIEYNNFNLTKSIDWIDIQNSYNNGLTYREIVKKYKISPQKIKKAREDGFLEFRNLSDAWKSGISSGRRKVNNTSDISIYKNYKTNCQFKFNVYDYPSEFDIGIVEKFGWYKASNNGNNPNGVSRDHMISIRYGFENHIDVRIISHPANCQLILQKENSRKNKKISLTLGELLIRINNWNIKEDSKSSND